MSISLNVAILDGNSPEFRAIANLPGGTIARKEWEEEHGSLEDRPGVEIETDYNSAAISGTDDEYGGYVINLAKLPKNATHIVVYRS